jgi:hypothetical protein
MPVPGGGVTANYSKLEIQSGGLKQRKTAKTEVLTVMSVEETKLAKTLRT